jgi:secondary thiamine-phosphate synthase enzyme
LSQNPSTHHGGIAFNSGRAKHSQKAELRNQGCGIEHNASPLPPLSDMPLADKRKMLLARNCERLPMQTTFTISTSGPGLYEFTPQVINWVKDYRVPEGVVTLFIRHTSASLLIQENADPEVQTDLRNYFHRLVPPTTDPSMQYLTHTYEGPDDMPAHIKATLLPVSLQIPVMGGRLCLGTWQGIYIFEHRTAPHIREVMAMLP